MPVADGRTLLELVTPVARQSAQPLVSASALWPLPLDALENVDQRRTCHSDIPSVLAEIAAAARERRCLDSVGNGFGGFARWREELQLNLRSANY
jgi:hypothetical protein